MTTFASSIATLNIRPAESKDLKPISDLCSQFGFPAEEAILLRRLRLIEKFPNQVVFVAEVQPSKIVGWIHGYEAPSLLSDATVELGGLVVDQKFRRHGVGRALMDAIETWTQKRDFSEVLLATRIDRTEAQAFYKALGYNFVHTTHFLGKKLNSVTNSNNQKLK